METTETNRTVLQQTETNRNNPKFSEKYPNILSLKWFGWVFCLFRFNQKIKTLCFGIKAKQPKQTKKTKKKKNEKNEKKTKKPEKNPKFSVKNGKICSLSSCFGWSSVCFGSIETSKLSVSV
jgi:hypothetical protein